MNDYMLYDSTDHELGPVTAHDENEAVQAYNFGDPDIPAAYAVKF